MNGAWLMKYNPVSTENYIYIIYGFRKYIRRKGSRGAGEGQRPPEANEIWKYQIKWNHFHDMGTEYIFSLFLRPYYFLVPILSHFISYFLVYLLFTIY